MCILLPIRVFSCSGFALFAPGCAYAALPHSVVAAGASVVFLPPYSPDLGPIDLLFSKSKPPLRSRACPTQSPSC